MVSNRGYFSFSFILGKRKKSQGAKSRDYDGWGDDSYFVSRQKLLGDDGIE